jgi:LPXTG-site transpeptidase (sortase) family protein
MARRGRAVKLIAGCMIVVGAGLLLYTGYKVWDPFAGARQHAAQEALTRSWGARPALQGPVAATATRVAPVKPATTAKPAALARPATPAKPAAPALCVVPSQNIPVGQMFAFIQIPAFGPAWKFTVIQGTTLTQLATGPGHILGTALPSQAGDAGIAAHDVTAGNAFLHLDSLRTGDAIVITTKECVTTYRVYRQPYRVLYTDVGVLNPVGSEHTLTLVTCWPTNVLSFVTHRTIVQAAQISSVRR